VGPSDVLPNTIRRYSAIQQIENLRYGSEPTAGKTHTRRLAGKSFRHASSASAGKLPTTRQIDTMLKRDVNESTLMLTRAAEKQVAFPAMRR